MMTFLLIQSINVINYAQVEHDQKKALKPALINYSKCKNLVAQKVT